jgi:hypothetical protein
MPNLLDRIAIIKVGSVLLPPPDFFSKHGRLPAISEGKKKKKITANTFDFFFKSLRVSIAFSRNFFDRDVPADIYREAHVKPGKLH